MFDSGLEEVIRRRFRFFRQQDKGSQAKRTRNRLHKGGLSACKPMVYSPLTVKRRAIRRKWAVEQRDLIQSDWSPVLFMDKSSFCLKCYTACILVWRERST
ncbi:hypothetical protein TNCV_1606081 [Trichonephila clavipes]|nr:hypothetical protein TNCV_1606081 [Trichonephila clavipes]